MQCARVKEQEKNCQRAIFTPSNFDFDKSSIPTLTHSRMAIASLSFPLYSYPRLRPHYQDELGQEHEDIF